ncbi:MAG: type IV secretion system DNA-binding domain-containing protein, partial [Candidatus Peregrinibacteria bacterium]|nr:type IV secretion system DNA-binding domain-containing protein [Candidatus Peregrinibacteria bacterium]
MEIYQIFLLSLLGILALWQIVFWGRYFHRKTESKNLVHLKITLPRNDSKLDTEKRTEKDFHEQLGKAEQFFRALHETRDLNLYNVVMKRWLWHKPQISLELQFENRELSFVIVCDRYYQKIIQKQATTFYESAEIEIISPEKQFDLTANGKNHTNGYFLHTEDDFWLPLKTYKEIEDDALNNIANSFSKLDDNEKAAVQIVIHPMSKRWRRKAKDMGTELFKNKKTSGLKIPIIGPLLNIIWTPFRILLKGYDPAVDGSSNEPGSSGGDSYVRMLQTEEEIAKSVGEKANQSGFDTTIRLFSSSPNKERVDEILNGIFVAFNVFKGPNKFENKRTFPWNKINAPFMLHNFKYRLPAFFEKSSILCSAELGTIFHFPDARYNKIPTIKWLPYKVLPPPLNLPEEGIILGNSVYRGLTKPVRILAEDRTRHFYILGKSGSGKSVMLESMAGQDIANGEGVCVIDPHGDLVEDVLARVPKERAKDVVVFDPGDLERPMGLNILEANTEEEKDRASLDAMEIMIKLFGNEIFGPRIQHYFRNGCLTLMADKDEGATLIDIPRLFIDDDFQRYKVAKVKNPVVRAFWENEMAKTGDREKQEMIPYFTSKFGPFVTNTTMRNVIGQTKSAFNIREAMDNGKIILVNLSKGKIGGINAQLLGLIMVAKINQAAMGRVDIPKEERKDFYLYVDEFQNFATDTFASILSEARKYRLNLIMAHQYIAQLSESAGGVAIGQKDSKIRDAVFGNVGTIASFKVGAEDAEYLEKEYAPTLSQQDILGIANYKTY